VDRAAEALERAVNRKPDYYAALIKLGELCIERGETEEGEQKFSRVLESEPDNARAHAGLGRAASMRRDDAAAAKHYEKALVDESGEQAHYALAMAYRRLGRVAEAEEQLRLSEKATGELSSNDPLMGAVQRLEIGGSFEFRQGLDRLAERNFEQAMIHFQNVLRVKPEMAADAHYCIGNIRIRQGEPDLAIHQYKQALALRPKYRGAWSNLGTAYMKKREYAKASECYEREIEHRPREPQAHANLGEALEHLGRMDEAIEHYLRAVEFDMSLPIAQHRLASALSKTNRHEEAIPHWQEYLRIEPGDPSTMTSLAESLRAVGRPDDALQLEIQARASAEKGSTDPRPRPLPR
jgi:tetratricopeptide (TPR) repeat protein